MLSQNKTINLNFLNIFTKEYENQKLSFKDKHLHHEKTDEWIRYLMGGKVDLYNLQFDPDFFKFNLIKLMISMRKYKERLY